MTIRSEVASVTRRRSVSPAFTCSGSSAANAEFAIISRPREPCRSPTRAANVIPGRSTSSGICTCSMAGSMKTRTSRILTHGRSPDRMERGLYIAASGMLAEQVRQDQIANDLANSSTSGYKSDRSSQRSFGDLLLQNSASGEPIGPLGLGTTIARTVTDLSQASIRDTGEPLDFAIEGTGFFQVRTPQGIRFTRNGQFMRSAQGTLTDALGNQVLGQNGRPITVRADGTVATNPGVFNVPNARKQGDSLFTGTASGRATGTVRNGALEASGTDPARAMIDMITSERSYEAGQKVIRTIDETLQKAVTSVPSIS